MIFIFLLCRPYDAKNPFLSQIKVNRELHTGGDRSCMHIEFDLEGSKMRYDSGNDLDESYSSSCVSINWLSLINTLLWLDFQVIT